MDNNQFLQAIDTFHGMLSSAGSIGIVLGRNHSLDTVSSALSLYLSLAAAQKNVQVVSSEDPIVEHSNLVGVDKIKRSFSGKTNTLVVSIPFNEGEVEKVSYSTEGDRMNFSIMGGENGVTPFETSDVHIIARGATPDLIIAVGVQSAAEIAELTGGSNARIVTIGTNPSEQFGDVRFVNPGFSSVAEIVTVLLQELALPLDADTSQNLLDGVISATHNFTSPQTSSFAFEAAAILLRTGARRVSAREREHVQQPMNNAMQNQQNRGNNRPQQNNMQMNNRPQQQMQSPRPMPQPQYNAAAVENKEAKPMSDDTQGEPQDVPSDWFVPKVFKGSKKPGQQQ